MRTRRLCSGLAFTPWFLHMQSNPFKGAVLLAPMLSLERVSKEGLNPYLE